MAICCCTTAGQGMERIGTGSVMDLSAGVWRLLSRREDENRDKPGSDRPGWQRVRSVSVVPAGLGGSWEEKMKPLGFWRRACLDAVEVACCRW